MSAKTIDDLVRETAEINTANGWRTEALSDPADATEALALLALVHTEVSEAAEELRRGHAADEVRESFEWPTKDPNSPPTVLIKRQGVPAEIADVVIRCFDLAGRYGFNLGAEIEAKLDYNAKRGHRHGGKVI